jgi:hypothetical protein
MNGPAKPGHDEILKAPMAQHKKILFGSFSSEKELLAFTPTWIA